ncbi:MAG: autotransporter domain-containing protein [Betaproteobacteria bacterium]|nr:autotransporter domain-containing protein [Betaproteobacteria bacterium]
MSLKKKLLTTLVAGTLSAAATTASAVPFTGVVVFGDSLSDSGAYRPGLVPLVGASGAAALGRFTTNPGPVWAELIAQTYGGNGAPFNAGGANYAQGGMRVALPAPASLLGPGGAQRPVSTQITEYLATRAGAADANALYAVWVGANDIFANLGAFSAGAIDAATLQANVLGAANAEIAQIARLRAAGARYIIVFNIPDIGVTPQFAGTPTAGSVTALAAGYNVTLFTGLQASGLRVIPVDAFSILADIRANAGQFGFTNITAPACQPVGSSSLTCSAANTPAGAATSYLFADGVHPSTGAHRIIADVVKSLIEGPNAYSVLAEVPLSTRAAHIRTLDEGIAQGRTAAVGKITPFVAVENSKFDIGTNSLSPATDTKNRAGTVGVSMRASEDVTVGIGAGSSKGEARMPGGGFDVKESTFSAFASGKWGGFYGSATGSIANLKFDSVRRSIQLGTVTRVASSETKGANASFSFMGGYDWSFGRLTIGPFAGYTNQSVDVNGFSETGAGSAGLKILDQRRDSQVSSLGVRASLALGNWTPFLRISEDKENRGEERFVSANPLTVTSGNTYDIPAYSPDGKWTTATLGIRGKLADRVGLSVVYHKVSSRQNIKQDGVAASVAVDF